jgi:D-psicose/D-tagatose/L-ribulose 3-epimerase
MKFGMNLLLWTDVLTEAHYPLLERLKKMGYDGVEIPIFDPDVKKYAALGKRLDDMGLERTAVTVRGGDDNPISADAAVRAKGVAATSAVLESCQAAGMTHLCGPYHSALGVFSGQGPTEEEWKWGVESMRQVAEQAGKCGVMLAVEYLNRFETYLLTSVADTVHVHISENDRGTPGEGHVHWDETFDALKATGYEGWMVVEAFGLALPALAAATKNWRRMYQDEEQLARDALVFMKREWGKRA